MQKLLAGRSIKQKNDVVPGRGVSLLVLFASQMALEDANHDERAAFAQSYSWLLTTFRRDKRLKSFALFRNAGSGAGASVRLPHHQFWGMPVPTPEDDMERAWAGLLPGCPTCQLFTKSAAIKVTSNKHAILIVRPAARFGGELLVLPRRHVQSFTKLTAQEKSALLELVATGERRLKKYFKGLSYNEIWHDWKLDDTQLHMRVEIVPRVNFMGGLEVGEAVHVNPYKPETVGRELAAMTNINAH
jgi:galactose-1-phosphate uridylyltransferase